MVQLPGKVQASGFDDPMHIQLDHITKTFGSVRANDDISLTLMSGRIYAVLGENGAGKSTLMKILSGYQPPDGGSLLMDGMAKQFANPADALAAGIGMLHQDPLDVGSLTVLENFMLGRPTNLFPDWRVGRDALLDTSMRLGFTLSPHAYIDTLTIGARQQAEIVRLLSIGARLLILDEPTTGISAEQKQTLFNALKRLARERGMTVALVSHKLEDVEALCDEAYVLRAGRVAGHVSAPFSAPELVRLMFGRSFDPAARAASKPKIGPPALEADSISVATRRLIVKDVTLNVTPGEVIGLAGLDGSGQTDFLRICAGIEQPKEGTIWIGGIDMTGRAYHHFRAGGVAFTPAGRLEEGLIAGLSIVEHFALSSPPRVWVDWTNAELRASSQIGRFNIRGKTGSPIQTLSGGNQQRTLLALLPEHLSVLLLEDPTRGLDVESSRWIWSQLLARREHSTAILFTSPDLDEILLYSDRVLVFSDGRTTLIDDPAELTTERLGALIGGKSADVPIGKAKSGSESP